MVANIGKMHLYNKEVLMPRFGKRVCVRKRSKQKPVKKVARKQEAQNHPPPGILELYSLNPDKLGPKVRKLTQKHIQQCPHCWHEVDDLTRHAEYFRRQKTVLGDCD